MESQLQKQQKLLEFEKKQIEDQYKNTIETIK